MARALTLATRGRATTDPNPAVGCVLVRDEVCVGEGWHERAGGPHAEVRALEAAGERARGATAYVSLEPCAHHGRTPPCVRALLAAGVSRVVAAVEDPDPRVRGRGMEALRAGGCAVETGVLEASAVVLNRGFFMRHRHGRPWVILKIAVSLDGGLAARPGERTDVTGEEARRDVQRLRALASAVLTGAGTVLADDPRLDVRAPASDPPVRQPLRLVWDREGRTDPHAQIYRLPGPSAVVTAARHAARYAAAGVEPIVLDIADGGDDPWQALLARLAARAVNVLLVEGGPRLAASCLAAGCTDELVVYLAPRFFGGGNYGLAATSVPLDGEGFPWVDVRPVGNDLRLRAVRPEHADWLPYLRQEP
jgi:diaminohydroxyphosphoribosylaminopyrimidine deaminase/5-amino-6-(5-phosphoribosylamino)uracil reductase